VLLAHHTNFCVQLIISCGRLVKSWKQLDNSFLRLVNLYGVLTTYLLMHMTKRTRAHELLNVSRNCSFQPITLWNAEDEMYPVVAEYREACNIMKQSTDLWCPAIFSIVRWAHARKLGAYINSPWGSSIYDVHKKIRFLPLLPLSTCVHMGRTPLVDVHTRPTWNTHCSLEMASSMTYRN